MAMHSNPAMHSNRTAPPTCLLVACLFLGFVGVLGLGCKTTEKAAESASKQPEAIVYVAQEIITMDPARPVATAVAVTGTRFSAVGSKEEVLAALGAAPHRVDDTFADHVLVAGLIDQHVHPWLAALTLTAEIISFEDWVLPSETVVAVVGRDAYLERLVAVEAAMDDENEPLLTWGFHHLFHGKLTRSDLDAISNTRPILVWHRSAHEYVLNTAALDSLGITQEFVDSFPPSAKAQSNWEEGHFWEQGLFGVLPKIQPVVMDPNRLAAGLVFAQAYLHANGVTLTSEPGGITSKGLQDLQNQFFSGPRAPFRTYYMPDGRSMAEQYLAAGPAIMLAETESVLAWGRDHGAYLPKQVKLFADGAIFSQLMRMQDGYLDGHEGAWMQDPEMFKRAFAIYWDAGYQIHVHVNGDEGLELVLDTLETNLERAPRDDHRTTLVHFGFSTPEQVGRIARAAAIVSANPYYTTALADRYGEVGIGPERADEMVRLGDLTRADILISLHSDMPMAPGRPLFLMWSAVNRTTLSGRVAGPEQRLSRQEALSAITIDSAYSLRLEHEVGSVEPGKLANLTVLDANPLEVAADAIKDIGVWGTVVEGVVQPGPHSTR